MLSPVLAQWPKQEVVHLGAVIIRHTPRGAQQGLGQHAQPPTQGTLAGVIIQQQTQLIYH